MVKSARAPLLLIELANHRSAALVVGCQRLVRILRLLGKCLREPVALRFHRGIDKNMKAARLTRERACRSSAYENTVAKLRRRYNLFSDQRQHAFGIKDLLFRETGHLVG